ncbi:hypothetical protein HerbRD11066_64010 [Herbidospora sp. RD11066]
MGAGVSKEAGVPLAQEIAEEIRDKLAGHEGVTDVAEWARRNLAWDDPKRRYLVSIESYGSVAQRLSYFRKLLVGRRPAFAHHALSLLMAKGFLHGTALTINFDKLLENAFVEQGLKECQPIRVEDEVRLWRPEKEVDSVFKLHGDYDTHNIANTRDETRSIESYFAKPTADLLRGRGLVVLGSAGHEKSLVDFIQGYLFSEDPQVLARGFRWGIHLGESMPSGLTHSKLESLMLDAVSKGAINAEILTHIGDANRRYQDRRPCAVFPIWGAGNFLHGLIGATGDRWLQERAHLFLDHEMRVRATFEAQGLTEKAIERHLERLKEARRRTSAMEEPPKRPRLAVTASQGPTELRMVYGDIGSQTMMADPEFSGRVRAVVSPEDTTISAGGGVAYALLMKAGPRFILNELAKYGPIDHGTSAVTSAGELPVHYIFHAAALKVDAPGDSYVVDPATIKATVRDVLDKANALKVETIWIPLIGAGVASLPARDSFGAIVDAIGAEARPWLRTIIVVVYDEGILNRHAAAAQVESLLPGASVKVSTVA